MIMKMIQNLESKMELQINSLETKIEMMQEMFNKDLEEIKKSQLKMNNAINEIKITLEGTMSSFNISGILFAIFGLQRWHLFK